MSVALEKIKPSDCVLAFGIPTCKEEFEKAKNDSLERDLVKNIDWDRYEESFVRYLKKIEPQFLKLGVRVIHRLTLQDYGKLFRDSSNKVIILFSHWKKTADTVEFFNGMATIDEITGVVPEDFDGIIDLTVCHPRGLAIKLRERLTDKSLIKFVNKRNAAHLWLYFYWAVFTFLNDSIDPGTGNPGATYLEALEKSVEEFNENE
jgi:hypothetical protein